MKIGKPDIFKLFEDYDDKGKDLIDYNDVVSCFKLIGVTLSMDQANSIKKCFESEETGKIEYALMKREFLKHL